MSIVPYLLLAACDSSGKSTDTDDNQTGDSHPRPDGADAVWLGDKYDVIGGHLSATPSDRGIEVAAGSDYGLDECPDSGVGDCFLNPSSAQMLRFAESGSPAALVVAHLAAAQAIFVTDCNGDGQGEVLAGMGGATGALLVDGSGYSELATYGAAPNAQSWIAAIGTGNSLPQGWAVLVQKEYSYLGGDAGVYFFETERRGALEMSDADASYFAQTGMLYTAGVGDLDGDGLDDLVAGMYGTEGGCEGLSVALAPFEGLRSSGDDGWCVHGVGGVYPQMPLVDMDMDGYLDLLTHDGTAIRLFPGPIVQNLEPLDARVSIRTPSGEVGVGSFDGIGDFNGDGLQDLAFGVPHAKNGENYYAGQVYVFYAPTGALDMNDRDILYGGIETDGELGYALTGVPDINADGRDELAVGAPRVGEGGAVYLFLGE